MLLNTATVTTLDQVARGGGVSCSGTTTIDASTFSVNAARNKAGNGFMHTGAGAEGGAISCTGTLTITNSTITGNSAASGPFNSGFGRGGGLMACDLTVTGSTRDNNFSGTYACGNPQELPYGSTLIATTGTITNSTISANLDPGAILVGSGPLTLSNTSVYCGISHPADVPDSAGTLFLRNSIIFS